MEEGHPAEAERLARCRIIGRRRDDAGKGRLPRARGARSFCSFPPPPFRSNFTHLNPPLPNAGALIVFLVRSHAPDGVGKRGPRDNGRAPVRDGRTLRTAPRRLVRQNSNPNLALSALRPPVGEASHDWSPPPKRTGRASGRGEKVPPFNGFPLFPPKSLHSADRGVAPGAPATPSVSPSFLLGTGAAPPRAKPVPCGRMGWDCKLRLSHTEDAPPSSQFLRPAAIRRAALLPRRKFSAVPTQPVPHSASHTVFAMAAPPRALPLPRERLHAPRGLARRSGPHREGRKQASHRGQNIPRQRATRFRPPTPPPNPPPRSSQAGRPAHKEVIAIAHPPRTQLAPLHSTSRIPGPADVGAASSSPPRHRGDTKDAVQPRQAPPATPPAPNASEPPTPHRPRPAGVSPKVPSPRRNPGPDIGASRAPRPGTFRRPRHDHGHDDDVSDRGASAPAGPPGCAFPPAGPGAKGFPLTFSAGIFRCAAGG